MRTGLHYQLRNGIPPRSVRTAQRGPLRLFMEYDTLAETDVDLSESKELRVTVAAIMVVAPSQRHRGRSR